MITKSKERNDETVLKKVSRGNYRDYSPGLLWQQRFVIDEDGAKLLNIKPGTYTRSNLAEEIIKKTPNLTSSQYDKLAKQETPEEMRAMLNSLGLRRV
jgi:hypothetical protein